MNTEHRSIVISYHWCLCCQTKWAHKDQHTTPKCPKCGDTANNIATGTDLLLEPIIDAKDNQS